MLYTMVLNASVGPTELLVASGIGVFMGTETRMVVGSLDKEFEKVDLTYKGAERLVRADSPAVGADTRSTLGVDVVFLLGVVEY